MRLRSALLCIALAAAPTLLHAQPVTGLYAAGGLGGTWLTSTKLTPEHGGLGRMVSPNVGGDIYASLGYGFANGLRAEAELLGAENHIKVAGLSAYGKGTQWTGALMFNALYDVRLDGPVQPYVGLGAGYTLMQLGGLRVATSAPVSTVSFKPASLGSPAVQAIIGASLHVTNAWSLVLDYRLFDKLETRHYGATQSAGGNVVHTYATVGNEIGQMVHLGLHYAFDAPPEQGAEHVPAGFAASSSTGNGMAAMVPAPAPTRSFLVFFDWNNAGLDARARQIVADAAANAARALDTRIDVAGHADASGGAAGNQAISLARANAVAAELVRLGVARAAIAINAYGDTRPLVPTAPGAREGQNRRVEIVVH